MSNMTKIMLTQVIRVIINLIAVLIVLGAIAFNPATGAAVWLKVIIGDVLLWIAFDAACSIYLECLYERDAKERR